MPAMTMSTQSRHSVTLSEASSVIYDKFERDFKCGLKNNKNPIQFSQVGGGIHPSIHPSMHFHNNLSSSGLQGCLSISPLS